MVSGYIYAIVCQDNNKIYIGSTVRLQKRKYEHWHKLKNGRHDNKYMQNSWNLYGEKSFSFLVIDECNLASLASMEYHYVNITGSYNKEVGFNNTKYTNSPQRGTKKSEDIKKKISNTLKGRVSPNKGKKLISSKQNVKIMNESNKKKIINKTTGEIYNSVNECIDLNNFSRPTLYKNIGKNKINGNYYTYLNDTNNYLCEKKLKNHNKKVLNISTGEIFETIKKAAESIGVRRTTLNGCIIGRQKTCKGFCWRYA